MVTPALRAETRQEKLRWWKAASAEGSMPKAWRGGGGGHSPQCCSGVVGEGQCGGGGMGVGSDLEGLGLIPDLEDSIRRMSLIRFESGAGWAFIYLTHGVQVLMQKIP